jgi:hypothetical protein
MRARAVVWQLLLALLLLRTALNGVRCGGCGRTD